MLRRLAARLSTGRSDRERVTSTPATAGRAAVGSEISREGFPRRPQTAAGLGSRRGAHVPPFTSTSSRYAGVDALARGVRQERADGGGIAALEPCAYRGDALRAGREDLRPALGRDSAQGDHREPERRRGLTQRVGPRGGPYAASTACRRWGSGSRSSRRRPLRGRPRRPNGRDAHERARAEQPASVVAGMPGGREVDAVGARGERHVQPVVHEEAAGGGVAHRERTRESASSSLPAEVLLAEVDRGGARPGGNSASARAACAGRSGWSRRSVIRWTTGSPIRKLAALPSCWRGDHVSSDPSELPRVPREAEGEAGEPLPPVKYDMACSFMGTTSVPARSRPSP